MSRTSRRWRWLGAAMALLGLVAGAWVVSVILAEPGTRSGPDARGRTGSATADANGNVERDDPAGGLRGRRNRDGRRDGTTGMADDGSTDPTPDAGGTDAGAGRGSGTSPDGAGENDENDDNNSDSDGTGDGNDDTPADSDAGRNGRNRRPRDQRRGMLRSARDPTPRERLERERYRNGQRLPTADDYPESAGDDDEATDEELAGLDMTRIAEPEVWAEYWSRLGIPAPDMIPTPVVGKLIDRGTHQGLATATVRLFTFFPSTSRLDGPLLPLVVVTRTDDAGFFSFTLPVPDRWPSAYPKLGLAVEAGGRRVMDGLALDTLRPGEPNEIGVFWVPEEPFVVDAVLSVAQPGLTVVPTGRLDPLRWDARRAAATLAHFTATPAVALRTPVRGTWDPLGETPYLTLAQDGRPLITRQCLVAPQEAGGDPPPPDDGLDPVEEDGDGEPAIGQPFAPVTFPNDGTFSLAGTVTDADHNVIEGAVLKLTADGEERVAWSDGYGWFHFGSLPDDPVTVTVTHEDFVDEVFAELLPGTADVTLALRFRRPRLTLRVKRSDTGDPVTAAWFRLVPIANPGEDPVELGEEIIERREAEDGVYRIEHNLPLHSLHVEAVGAVPQSLPTDAVDPVDVWLQPGLELQRAPKNWDAVQNANAWNREPDNPEADWIWSLDDDHWVDYLFDFGGGVGDPGGDPGNDPGGDPGDGDGTSGERWVLELGVRNHTYNTLPLDNEFTFEVDVLVDGAKVGSLSIPSDARVPRYGRLALGRLAGAHTIRLLWTNDRYIPGQLDANIRYESLRILRGATD